MDWIKKHTDTVIVIGSIISCMVWMNGRFNELEKEIASIDKQVAIIKTVMIMKQIMPTELAIKDETTK